ncbi:MAG: TetR family transcriptional regulator [candidate division Zixibacteria bacterium]|nr:TetR family transcriptional regulator [candidate division Zixibacteria bacterium]
MGTAERKEREKIRRQNDILDAAEEVFFERGLKEATMEEVAEKAELSKGTLYLYFKNKEALYLGINLRALAVLRRKFEESIRQYENAGSKLLAIGRAYIDYAAEFPNYFRTMNFVETMRFEPPEDIADDPLMRECQDTGMGVLQLIANIVERGKNEGYFRPELDPMKTAMILWAAGNGVIQLNQNKGAHFCELHGFEKDFLLEEYMQFCERALFINPPDISK